MSVELLREAAKVLRHAARYAGARSDPWIVVEAKRPYTSRVDHDGDPQWSGVADVMWPEAGEYIALMHPPVALALASVLERIAVVIEEFAEQVGEERDGDLTPTDEAAISLARAILRRPS